jgi:DNA-binding GntR family transcriptional regulator
MRARGGSEHIAKSEVPRGERVNRAYQKLRDLIVRGRLAPGTRIIETEIAARLGVSRTPVRSALQRLQQEGYIVTPDSGRQSRPTVAPLTKEDARELFLIVGAIESLAGRLAAGLPDDRRSVLAAELQRYNTELSIAASAERPDENRVFDLDMGFHRCYVEAGGGPRLIALHDAIKPQAERYERLYISALLDEIHTSVKEHEAIIQGIRDGDGPAAQLAIETNWRNAAERLSKVIESMGERGSW